MRFINYLTEKRKTPRKIMYHGTSSEHLSSIMNRGLQYKGKGVEKVWDIGQTDKINPSRASLSGIYITNNIMIANRSARDASDKFGKNPLYVIVIFQPLSGLPDEDVLTNTIRNTIRATINDFWGDGHSNTFEQLSYLDIKLDKEAQYVETFKNKLIKQIKLFHNIEIDSRALKDDIIRDMLVSELERLISYDLEQDKMGSRSGFIRGYDIFGKDNVENIMDNIPSSKEAEKRVLQLTDKFTQMFKQIRTDMKQYMYNLRTKELIKFKGRNRIIAIVEETERNKLKIHYGRVPDEFINDYKNRISPNIEIEK